MPRPLTQTTGRRKAAVARVRLRPFQDAVAAADGGTDGGGQAAPAPAPVPPPPPAVGTTSAGPPPGSTDGGAAGEGGADAASVARVVINGRPIERYFPSATHRMVVTEPLRLTDTATRYAVDASIDGGGV